MTTPEYIPLIKKAAGVITNQGGMLCHAAIATRELHTPSILATKHATKVLKNGQSIILDATIGAIFPL